MTIGFGLIIAGIVGMAMVLRPDVPIVLALLAWGIAGLGMGFASPTLTLVSMELAPSGQEGASTSAMGQAGILGIALGAGIGGIIIGNANSGASVSPESVASHSLLMVGMLVIAVWVARGLPGRSQKVLEAEQSAGIY